jgi:phosphatidylglycerol lysyltransferase
MGVLTGALVRWRLLPGLSLVETGKLSLAVALSFFAGLAAVSGLSGLLLTPQFMPATVSIGLLLLFIFVGLLTFLHLEIRILDRHVTLPSLPAFCKITALTLLDTAAAALALYVLLPTGLDIGFAMLFPVYLAALTAALVTGTPGGVGPFELTALGLLPQGAAPELMAGILAFRLIYYALPTLIAAWFLYWGEANTTPPVLSGLEPIRDLPQDIDRAELGVCLQNGARRLAPLDRTQDRQSFGHHRPCPVQGQFRPAVSAALCPCLNLACPRAWACRYQPRDRPPQSEQTSQ